MNASNKDLVETFPDFYDVVILPPQEIRDHVISLSRLMQEFGSLILLGEESFLPHLSLYHIPVKPEDFESFVKILQETVSGHPQSTLQLSDIAVWPPHRSFFLNVTKPEWLDNLCSRVVERCLRLYDWDHGVRHLWGNLNPVAEANFKRYGTPMMGEYFAPHFTFAVLKDDDAMYQAACTLQNKFRRVPKERKLELEAVKAMLHTDKMVDLRVETVEKENAEFVVNRIFITKIGPSLSCQGTITEIPF